MIDYIIGEIKKIENDYVVIENNLIGYKVYTSLNSMKNFVIDETFAIHIEMVVREDSLSLYGFYSEDELDLFKKLTTVSSVGPKVGLAILSSLMPSQIISAIKTNDINLLTKAPGVGKKTASRIILELSDKISEFDYDFKENDFIIKDEDLEDAIFALTSLGYPRDSVVKVINEVAKEDLDLEDIMKKSMIKLSR